MQAVFCGPHPRTAVRSCHSVGKDYTAARIALTWLSIYEDSIVVTTAPTFRQVRFAMWQEIRRAYARARCALGGELLETRLQIDDGWYALGLSADDPDSFQGLHPESGRILVILDEASGVPPMIWEAADALLTSDVARLLSIGNPTDPMSRFAQEFRAPGVNKLVISAYDTPNLKAGKTVIPGLVTQAWVDGVIRRYGRTSPYVRSRVDGEFPDSASDALIPLAWIERAHTRWRNELDEHDVPQPITDPAADHTLGCDIADEGGDETVILERHGHRGWVREAHTDGDTMVTTGRIIRALEASGATSAAVDAIGVGAGVAARLYEQNANVEAVNVGEGAQDREHFANRRAEIFWGLRERFEQNDIAIDPADEELTAQLASLTWRPNSRGQVQLVSKDDLRTRLEGNKSPDRADALALGFSSGGYLDPTHGFAH